MIKIKNVLYINDLLAKSTKIKQEFKSNKKVKYYFIDWTTFSLFGKNNNLIEYYSQKILLFFKENINKKFDVIVDSFSGLIFCNIFEEVKNQINKIVFVNPMTKYIYLKSLTIKHIWLPKTRKNMIYKQMYIFHNFEIVRDNNIFLKQIYEELTYLQKYEFRINKIFNEILSYSNINRYLKFIKNVKHKSAFLVSEKNVLYSLKNMYDFKNAKQDNLFIFKSCGYNILWEQTLEFKKIINQLI